MTRALNKELFIEKAKEIHGDIYDYSKVEYVNNKTKVCIICPEHGEFWQIPCNHLKGTKCPCCQSKHRADIRRYTDDSFIRLSKAKHGNKYDYSKVKYLGSETKVCIICPEHGEFWQKPSNHLQGQGCPMCGVEKSASKKRGNIESFLEKAVEVHGNKYDYSKVKYSTTHDKVCIICPEHGEFWQMPSNHLKGQGCPKCGIITAHEKTTMSKDCFIDKAREIHGDKYDYSKAEYTTTHENICIICPKHGEFTQTPHMHLQGQGCPACASERYVSSGEEEVASYIESLIGVGNVIRNDKRVINPFELDIFIPAMSLAVEYNGLYWHSEAQGKDKNYHLKKLDECLRRGVRLYQIFEDEWIYSKEIVKSKLRHIINKDYDLPKIMARKCSVREINSKEAAECLNCWHVQGAGQATVALGCFYKEEAIGVMTFKKENNNSDKWELTRFATSPKYICQGVGGKLFKHFTSVWNPSEIKSFADRRWTADAENSLYNKLGFVLDSVLKPDYMYVNGDKREHKFGFRKEKLHKRYNLPLTMTEKEMTEKLGFHRIWNCGLYKFIWKKKERT